MDLIFFILSSWAHWGRACSRRPSLAPTDSRGWRHWPREGHSRRPHRPHLGDELRVKVVPSHRTSLTTTATPCRRRPIVAAAPLLVSRTPRHQPEMEVARAGPRAPGCAGPVELAGVDHSGARSAQRLRPRAHHRRPKIELPYAEADPPTREAGFAGFASAAPRFELPCTEAKHASSPSPPPRSTSITRHSLLLPRTSQTKNERRRIETTASTRLRRTHSSRIWGAYSLRGMIPFQMIPSQTQGQSEIVPSRLTSSLDPNTP
jgi:hypothetical protein